MRIVREQMLCIVTPDWKQDDAALRAAGEPLDKLLRQVGVVHFASFALLPAHVGPWPSLMFELAVDEGLRPADLIALLVYHDFETLWSIYQPYWKGPGDASVGERCEWLCAFLLKHADAADGAFVGVRDRSVAQIMQEEKLFDAARAARRNLATPLQRAVPAMTLARWAMQRPDFAWALEPAPRSYWRGRGASSGAKVVLVVAVVAVILAAMYLARWLFRLTSMPLFADLLTLSIGVVWTLVWLVLALLVVIVVGSVVPSALLPWWRKSVQALDRRLEHPGTTPVGVMLYLLVALLLVFDFIVVTWAGLKLLVPQLPPAWQASPWQCMEVLRMTLAALTLPVLVALSLLVGYGLLFAAVPHFSARWRRWIGPIDRWLHRPRHSVVPRAQQVHPSVEQCEAELVDKTAHMISVTEVRRPIAWHGARLLLWLRIVTFFGRVLYTDGRLGDAPGIKFGHWHLIEGGRRLLFCSNYDGAFGGYLDDFINGASSGLNLFWRRTRLCRRPAALRGHPRIDHPRRFPPTRFGMWRGVKCEQGFKAYARDSMLPNVYRFEAYNRSNNDIERATRLRDALFGARTQAKDDQIMRALES